MCYTYLTVHKYNTFEVILQVHESIKNIKLFKEIVGQVADI